MNPSGFSEETLVFQTFVQALHNELGLSCSAIQPGYPKAGQNKRALSIYIRREYARNGKHNQGWYFRVWHDSRRNKVGRLLLSTESLSSRGYRSIHS